MNPSQNSDQSKDNSKNRKGNRSARPNIQGKNSHERASNRSQGSSHNPKRTQLFSTGSDSNSRVTSRSTDHDSTPGEGTSQRMNELKNWRTETKLNERRPKPQGGLQGIVTKVLDFGCFIKPTFPLPDGYPPEADVLLRRNQFPPGPVLIPGDEITFVLGSHQKQKPVALAAQVKRFVNRSSRELMTFLKELSTQLDDPGVCLGLCSNIPLWESLSQADLSNQCVASLISFHRGLLKMPEYKESTLECTRALFSGRFGSRGGPLGRFAAQVLTSNNSRDLPALQEYLLLVMKSTGDFAMQIVQILEKGMKSMNADSTDVWIFSLLRECAKHVAQELGTGVLEWNCMPLIPSCDEILSDRAFDVRMMNGVRKDSGYEDSFEYMETYFKLLRTDCFLPIRKGIQEFLKGSLDLRDMNVFINVKLVAFYVDQMDGSLVLLLTAQPIDPKKKSWDSSSNLMFGNLLCLSPSGRFDDPLWATVRDKGQVENGIELAIQPIEELKGANWKQTVKALMTSGRSSVLVESPSYYMSVGPVLRTLQSEQLESVPFEDEIVFTKFEETPPEYIDQSSLVEYYHCTNDIGPRRRKIRFENFTLDHSQSKAFMHALTNRVTLIQGPPGTGKTFIGSIILQKILNDYPPSEPILVLTYKNHALDEFLKHMIKVVGIEGVVRVGGRCPDPELEACNLNVLRRERKELSLWKMIKEVVDEQNEMSAEIMSCIRKIDFAARSDLLEFMELFSKEEIGSFLENAPLSSILSIQELPKACNAIKNFCSGGSSDSSLEAQISSIFDSALRLWAPSSEEIVKYQRQFSRHIVAVVEKLVPKNKKGKERDAEYDLQDERDEEEMIREESDRLHLLGKMKIEKDKTIKLSHFKQKLGLHSFDWPCISNATSANLHGLWGLSTEERIKLLGWMFGRVVEEKLQTLDELCEANQRLARKKKQYERHHEAQVISKKKIIAMTVSGASINQDLLQNVKPSVVLVEEAAEILEPQLIAALGPWTKHLIMIGDHKQLKPPVENYELVLKCNFDVSLFERLILRNCPVATLSKQNRMRPEVAELLLDIYPSLTSNLERVQQNEVPNCLMQSVYFWDHNDLETKDRSVRNEGEAERVLGLLIFLLHQGISPSRITILATYLGQVRLLRKLIRTEFQKNAALFEAVDDLDGNQDDKKDKGLPVTISTVDNYQGDENDIVIVSLVRSNPKNQLGFVKTLNRRCVAQSRAKCAVVFIGNAYCLMNAANWSSLMKTLHDRKVVSNQMSVRCSFHPSTVLNATNGVDLRNAVFCTATCHRPMPCKRHFCKKPCQPGHDHFRCRELVDFIHENCGHSGEKQCSQDPSSVKCRMKLSHYFPDCHHMLTIFCHQRNESLSCYVDVDYTFPICQHIVNVKCFITRTDQRCMAKIQHKFESCGHTKEKVCHEDWTFVICKVPCSRKLDGCGHLCSRRCGERCDPKDCITCAEIEKQRLKAQLEAERKARKELVEQAKREYDEICKQLKEKQVAVSRIELEPDSAEFFSVKDRVLKYIQPAHNWFPTVAKVEKVTNLKLKAKWLEARQNMFRPEYSDLKFHGTNKAAVDAIIENGFLLPQKAGMYGRGIYFATDSSKSAQEIYTKGSNMLLLCDVLLGKAKTVLKDASHMTEELLRKQQCDSLFAPRDSKGTGGVLFDEFVVFDPFKALPVYIVHYEACGYGLPTFALSPSASGGFRKIELKEDRAVKHTDPMQILYRIAESQFYRLLAQNRQCNKMLSKVEYIVNPAVQQAYEKKKAHFISKYGASSEEAQEILVFHGTSEQNIDSIAMNNFDIGKIQRCAYGRGMYFSEDPSISFGYMNSTNKLLLCYLLPGRVGPSGGSVAPGYDSIGAHPDAKGRHSIVVIDKMDQVRPAFILHLS